MIETLIKRIDAYQARHKIGDVQFGRRSNNDKRLMERLRAGGDVTTRTYLFLDAFLKEDEDKHASETTHDAA